MTLLKTSPIKDLPLTLELKEKAGGDAPSLTEQLAAGTKALDRLEELR